MDVEDRVIDAGVVPNRFCRRCGGPVKKYIIEHYNPFIYLGIVYSCSNCSREKEE